LLWLMSPDAPELFRLFDLSSPNAVSPQRSPRRCVPWESEADWDRFAEQRLHPVVHGLLGEIFGDELPPEPERTALSVVVHVWCP
jgi:hypothetical protein